MTRPDDPFMDHHPDDPEPERFGPEPPPPRPRGWHRPLRKYAKICRVTLTERLTYRGDFFFSTLLRFLPMLTTILLWGAIYEGSGKGTLNGFDLRDTIAYLLMVNISRMFSSMPGLAAGIARDIREGNLKRYLLQPVDMITYLVSYRVAHKISYIVSSFLPYVILFVVCRSYFYDNIPTDAVTWLAYALTLVLAFLIGFFFEVAVGMVGFWFLEVTSLLYIVMTLNFFLSGHMFPLDLLPPFWAGVLRALPFQYMAYFPAVVFLGKIKGPDLIFGLAVEVAWIVGFAILARYLYRAGLRRYGAYGG
jgi:ABC-2 type transport system permease protein